MVKKKSGAVTINEDLRAGLTLLFQASVYAHDAGVDAWDFALEIDKLYETGLTISDLRWLYAKGYIEHARETSVYGDTRRSFRAADGFNFGKTTCLVLTQPGAAFARIVIDETAESELSSPSVANKGTNLAVNEQASNQTRVHGALRLPSWDEKRRELSLGDKVVKRFRVPARNQEMILCVFEEEGWPEHIDDPLPFSDDIDAQTRLHDTIHRLNGHQTNRLLCFHGNGHGTGILWEIV